MRRVVATQFPDEMLLESSSLMGAAIRAARTQSGLTLADAALSAGVSKQTMQRIETDPSTVSFGLLLQVGRLLGVSLFAVPSASRGMVHKAVKALVRAEETERVNHEA
jgi:transcriptional regulator with XRE-family HTH domain